LKNEKISVVSAIVIPSFAEISSFLNSIEAFVVLHAARERKKRCTSYRSREIGVGTSKEEGLGESIMDFVTII
jgi:hypothetical protein